MDPAGKVAVVTGGNSGLGAAAALRLAAADATVVTLDRGGAAPGGLATVPCDVSDDRSVADAVAQVIDRHGRIEHLRWRFAVEPWNERRHLQRAKRPPATQASE